MANWWTSREAVKLAGRINGSDQHSIIDRIIEAESRRIEKETGRWYIPRTETRLYRWPALDDGRGTRVYLDADLLAVTTLKTKAQDASPTTVAAADYFLEPVNELPYRRIEIDLSSSAAFEAGDTPQRSISVLGRWAYSEDTKTAGTVSSGLATDATVTSFVCSDGSLIDVGDTLLIGTEQLFVSERVNADSTATNSAALAADVTVVTVGVNTGTLIKAGEIIMIDSERMLVTSISGNNLTVKRAWDGSVLASHLITTAIHVFRTLTIVRGVNGTTAAVHANAVAITKYAPPLDISQLNIAAALATYQQEQAAWGREVGGGEGAVEFSGRGLGEMRKRVIESYRRMRMGAV